MKPFEKVAQENGFVVDEIAKENIYGAREMLSGWYKPPGSNKSKKPMSIVATVEDGEVGIIEHVSVSYPRQTPTWEEMCMIKDLFWYDEEEVYQIHPKKSEYVNFDNHCLHLWRRQDGKKLI